MIRGGINSISTVLSDRNKGNCKAHLYLMPLTLSQEKKVQCSRNNQWSTKCVRAVVGTFLGSFYFDSLFPKSPVGMLSSSFLGAHRSIQCKPTRCRIRWDTFAAILCISDARWKRKVGRPEDVKHVYRSPAWLWPFVMVKYGPIRKGTNVCSQYVQIF